MGVLLSGLALMAPSFGGGQTNQSDDGPAKPEVQSFIGLVIKVVSGDQLAIMLPSGKEIMVSLAGIRAPKAGSLYGRLSQRWLRGQLQGQLVSAECAAVNSVYDCAIFPDDRHINLVSLYHGLSVHNGRGSVLHGDAHYKKYEQKARENKSGLWQMPAASETVLGTSDY